MANNGVPICIMCISPFILEPKYSLMTDFHKAFLIMLFDLKELEPQIGG